MKNKNFMHLSIFGICFMNSLGNSMSKNAKHYYVTITIFGIHVKWTKHVETSKFKFLQVTMHCTENIVSKDGGLSRS
jgi:hypothetical protein